MPRGSERWREADRGWPVHQEVEMAARERRV
jgi:hypothetical protein